MNTARPDSKVHRYGIERTDLIIERRAQMAWLFACFAPGGSNTERSFLLLEQKTGKITVIKKLNPREQAGYSLELNGLSYSRENQCVIYRRESKQRKVEVLLLQVRFMFWFLQPEMKYAEMVFLQCDFRINNSV